MSIRRQLALCIGLLMLLIMSGNLVINVLQLQSNYEQQLKARADETATTLALSMSHSALLEDDAALRSMVDVVFDRGHFAQIRFDYLDSDRSVVRDAEQDLAPNVPRWFKNAMKLSAGAARAHVSQGWQQLGYLTVTLHPGAMYLQLSAIVALGAGRNSLVWTDVICGGVRLKIVTALAAATPEAGVNSGRQVGS